MSYLPKQLPAEVLLLCERISAPALLVAHLRLVHDAALSITARLREHYPALHFSTEEVLLGAATHDLGKVLHPEEMTGPGDRHEESGPEFLIQQRLPPHLARFARTHARWTDEGLLLEDLLVALADHVWKGKRDEHLESLVIAKIAEKTSLEPWEVFATVDEILDEVASLAGARLVYQKQIQDSM
ncbi:hypothetical protein Psta_3823 [Pirellula staleyi DSM 6068]|uniref:HD domain-containing protein n=1 Tax=Pirellula staleyi (strain ATCC 27377 / DSM 6068 / ICPB 4128) TaxID=530564 RepID=D2R0Z3_PIRSD|nr:HD domain-containing protein [Pirellula staleyi]ADB18478.1 hypothetical protein Psta_3823 [Pirellula staleyi DSM 6068]